MEDVQIILSALWVALILTYLWGDVLRIYSGDFKAGEIGGMKISQNMWLGIAVLMVVPIVMVSCLNVELPCESLGKHRNSPILFRFQPHWVAQIPFCL